MAKRTPHAFRPGVLQLESRETPTVIGSPQLSNGILTVKSDNTATTILVTQSSAGSVQVQDILGNNSWSFAAGQVRRVDLNGGNANDTFTSRGAGKAIIVKMFGGAGDDTLLGGSEVNKLFGGGGNDSINGGKGKDKISGEAGDDNILGSNGQDILSGGAGIDNLNGGAGADDLSGDDGDDTLITIDDTLADTADGGNGVDALWIDQNGTATDKLTGVDGQDVIRAVAAFANGADRTLDGDKIDDPTTLAGDVYETFTGRPLFADAGPTITDIVQSAVPTSSGIFVPILGDGWLLAGLGSVTNFDPLAIRSNIVDFGDGTYGIQMGGFYVRVDNDLPVQNFGSQTPAYAGLGAEESMWVAVYEKAYAFFLTGANDYATLQPTGGANPAAQPSNVFSAFLFPTSTDTPLSQFIDAAQLGVFIKTLASSGFPITVTTGPIIVGVPLDPDQAYSLVGITLDADGLVTQVTLRNPLGIDGGGSTDLDPLDGLVTLTINELFSVPGILSYAVP